MAIDKVITCWDTESTGLVFGQDRLIEVAFVTKKNGKVISEYQQFINPEIKVSQGAYEVHKISDAMLKDKPTFREIYTDILDYMIESNFEELGAYNGDFDTIMLSMEFERLKSDYPHLPSMHEYIKSTYPNYIPYKERIYTYNPETNNYSYTGTPIKDLDKEITSIVDMFPCVDLMPPLIQGTLSMSNSSSGRESLNTIVSRLDITSEKIGINLDQRKEKHGALIDTHIAFVCYEEAIRLKLLEKPILELEFKFSGKEIPNLNLNHDLKISHEIASQAISFKDRKKFALQNEQNIDCQNNQISVKRQYSI